MARAAAKKKAPSRAKAGTKTGKRRAAPAEPARRFTWFTITMLVIGFVLAMRLGVNAAELIPVQFDEGQYWAYGQELDWGYYSKPPLAGAVIRFFTDIAGHSLFALRLHAPIAHALIAWMIFLTGQRLWDGRTGFWAATGYTLGPGVALSSMLSTTDPVMMLAWAVALYTLVLGLESVERFWSWVVCGVAIGLGLLAKYTMIAFPLAAVAFMATTVDPSRKDWRGLAIACGIGFVIFTPNLVWQATNGFATIGHVAGDADPGDGYFNIGSLLEFTGAQLAVIGPPFFIALIPALMGVIRDRRDWALELLGWQTWLLLGAMIVLSFLTRANGNWAAPAYVAGSLMAAHWILQGGRVRWLKAQVGLGLTLAILLYAVALLYDMKSPSLPAGADPFRKARGTTEFCERVLGAMSDENAEVMLSNTRKRLSECMFEGHLGWDEVAIWNPDLTPQNHHELVSTLRDGDERRMILAVTGGDIQQVLSRFRERTEIETGTIRTHNDRELKVQIWVVEGFRGYPPDA